MNGRVGRYYREKTDALLEKYGPGPRVHFHLGFAEAGEADCEDPSVLRERLFRSQQAVRMPDSALPARGDHPHWLRGRADREEPESSPHADRSDQRVPSPTVRNAPSPS